MVEFFQNLFNTDAYPPRWTCGAWTPAEGYLHIFSDIGVWGAYTAIPMVLAYFVLTRKDLPLPRIFWLFVLFIFSCGFNHLVEAAMFWWPAYRFNGVVKAFTAVASWITVIALVRVAPVALRLPGLAVVNADLRRANEELNEFAHIVSHDLRAPLRSIRSLAEWIREDMPDDIKPEVKENLDLLQSRVQRLDGLVEAILRYSRTGRQPMELHRFSAQQAAGEVISLLNIPPGMKVSILGRLPNIEYNEVQFQQVLLNLIQNALKHMGSSEGEVEISHEEREDEWLFRVRDTGPGIPPEHFERIFKIFQTLRPLERDEVGGIGLALVRKSINAHGGKVWVESRLGEGSTFLFTVPKRIMSTSAVDAALGNPERKT